MTLSVYRVATQEAIKEMILANAEKGRFGLLISDDSLDALTSQLCDFMESTLRLRTGVRERMERAAANADANSEREQAPSLTPTLAHRLPRTRIALSEEERSRIGTRS
jgi:hypothetical protein